VDFIIEKRGRPVIAVETKWKYDAGDLPGLRSFKKSYPDAELYVITSNDDVSAKGRQRYDGVNISTIDQFIKHIHL
jgi:hypothetical protein